MSHQHLTTFAHDPILDLDPWVGQRQASFRFELIDGTTGQHLGDITPIRSGVLSHDTTRTIKRSLTLNLGTADTNSVDTIKDRVLVFMTFPGGAEYALGRYMFTDASRSVFTSGRLGDMTLSDEMFLVDQQIEKAINGVGGNLASIIPDVLAGLGISYDLEPSPFTSNEAWGIGANRGSILESLAVTGDYFSPWFDNSGVLRFIRTFNPVDRIPDFDWDNGNKVIRDGILETDDLLTAPNRFIVVSNAADDPTSVVVATADVPQTAPHSIINRGFVIAEIVDLQLANQVQAQAVATGISERFLTFERLGISTALDPRHDSYNVIKWQGSHWLELGWSMNLIEGATMSHLLRKAYTQ